MAKVFVSYSRKDIEFAKRLTAELQKSDLDFWIDWEGIPPTVDWWREIEKGIEEADVFIFLISSDSSASKVCGKEIDCAVKNAKRIIPLVVRDIKGDEAPQQLSHLNWIFFRESDDFDGALKKLMTAVQTDYEWAATHRRLQVKALDWERNNKDNGFLLRGRDLLDAEQDLATNTSKDPHPTDLQREYVLASRKATDRQRRINTSISIAGVIALAALAVIAFVQAGLATASRNDAQAASTLAVANEQTAQAASTIAVSNEQKANEQAQIALARQLAVQAQLLNTDDDTQQMVASLLSIQSLKLHPTTDAINFVLSNNFAAPPVVNIPSTNVKMLAFSPDDRHIISVGCTGSEKECVRMWDITTGKEVFPVINDQQSISNIIFSHDGNRIFAIGCDKEGEYSACTEKSVRIYAMNTGQEIEQVRTNPNAVVSVSPDQKHIISYTCNNYVSVAFFVNTICLLTDIRSLEISTHKETIFKTPESEGIAGISPSGKYVSSFSFDLKTVYLRELETGKELYKIEHEFPDLFSAVIYDDSKGNIYIATISPFAGSSRINVWNVAQQQEIINAQFAISNALASLTFSPNAQFIIATGINSERTRIWQTSTSNEAHKLLPPAASVYFSANGKYFVSNTKNVSVVRETATGNEVARMTHERPVTAVALSPSSQYAASADDKSIYIWRVATAITRPAYERSIRTSSPNGKYEISYSCEESDSIGNCIQSRVIGKETLTERAIFNKLLDSSIAKDTAFNSDGKYFIGSTDKKTYIWETATGREIMKIPVLENIHISPDGDYLISGDNSEVSVWEVKTGKKITTIPDKLENKKIIISPNSEYLSISGSSQNNSVTHVWMLTTGEEISSLTGSNDELLSSFSHNGEYLASLDKDKILRVRSVLTGNEIVRKSVPKENDIWEIMFSPNDKLLGYRTELSNINSTEYISTIQIWDFMNNINLPDISFGAYIWTFSFSPDDKYVVSTSPHQISASGDTRIWDIATGNEIVRLSNGVDVSSASFVMEGKYLLSMNDDNVVVVWPWQSKDVIETMCMFLPRNLTRAEWSKYIGDSLSYPQKQEDATCSNLPIESEISITPTP